MPNLEIVAPTAVEVKTIAWQAAPAKPATIEALTGLRFVAAGLVYLTHLYGFSSAAKILPQWLGNIMYAGSIGVPLFFVLSGFVITYNYADRLARPNKADLRDFFVARFARIYPLYFLALLLSFSTYNVSAEIKQNGDLILQHLLMIQVWNPKVTRALAYNPPGWSIGVEVIFYLCFPLLAWLVLPRLQKVWQLLALAGLAYGVNVAIATYFNHPESLAKPDYAEFAGFWLLYNPVGRLGDFVVGCVAAQLYLKWQSHLPTKQENRWGTTIMVGAFAALGAIMVGAKAYVPFVYTYDVLYIPFFVVIVFCLARYRNWVSRFLSTRPMILLGEASFSFYLLHYYFVSRDQKLLSQADLPGAFLRGVIIFGLIIVLSLSAYTFIEKPARRFIRELARRKAA